jgi:hypothetical protein
VLIHFHVNASRLPASPSDRNIVPRIPLSAGLDAGSAEHWFANRTPTNPHTASRLLAKIVSPLLPSALYAPPHSFGGTIPVPAGTLLYRCSYDILPHFTNLCAKSPLKTPISYTHTAARTARCSWHRWRTLLPACLPLPGTRRDRRHPGPGQ